MKKLFGMMAIMVMATWFFTSCSSDDDDNIVLSESSVTMKCEDTKTLKASGDVNTWKSENEFVATVSEGGVITAEHVGETNIMASGNGGSAMCKVTVEGKYNYYIEPLCKKGITKSDVKKYESRELKSETDDGLYYTGENSMVGAVAYSFDDSGKLKMALVMLPHHNSTTLAKQLTSFLLERYKYAADLDGVYSFVDANRLADATKIVYMQVAPKGYSNYVCITYSPYEK